ncbi:MAG: tetratricopeptide repeat protein [Blastocatellales bacterium]
MDTERWKRTEELFAAALEQEPERREAFLQAACADDPALRVEVESLLDARAHAANFIETPASAFAADLLPEEARANEGKRCGPYRLIREIGRGGMGEVWLAERDDGRFDQRVAIKVIKRGMDTDEVSRRFAQERRILAQLNHPGIARLLDGGETADGRPWFALEYVEGERLDHYCESRKLGLKERLELFREICAAVQYAHQNLVIHRDLKPGNILVTEEDAPKLLDFGIAKLLDPEGQTTGLTGTWQRVMTLDYASPEQAGAGVVTTASDVYSLGVILYELLTGRRPYDLANLPLHEATRIICEREPRAPSRGDATPETTGWSGNLASDLDNIALKALRKEPDRRYASVAELAEDIRRYLDGLPVGATGDTLAYRAAKFVRRNKRSVAAAAAIMLALVIGLVVAMWQAESARAQEKIAKQESANKQAINDFIRDILSNANPTYGAPGHGKGPDVTLPDVLEYAEKKIDEQFKDQPEIRGELHFTLGQIRKERGEYNSADRHFRATLELFRRLHGDHHPLAIQSLYYLGYIEGLKGNLADSVTMMRKSVEMMRLVEPQNGTFPWMLLNLAERLGFKEGSSEAEALILEAREACRKMAGTEDHLVVAYSFCRLGNLYKGKGELERAQAAYREYLERLSRLTVKHEAGEALYNLGVIDYTKGNYQEAEKLLNEADKLFSQYLGADYPQIAEFLYYLASIHCSKGDYARAETEARRALEISQQKYGPNHLRTINSLVLLSKALISGGRSAQAIPYLREAMGKFRATPKSNIGKWFNVAGILGECLTLLKRYDEAERFLSESYTGFQSIRGERSPEWEEARQRLVKLYEAWGKPEQAARFRG